MKFVYKGVNFWLMRNPRKLRQGYMVFILYLPMLLEQVPLRYEIPIYNISSHCS